MNMKTNRRRAAAGRPARAARAETERRFLGSVMRGVGEALDGECSVIGEYAGASWRDFTDRRHQALWRALVSLDFAGGPEERYAVLEAEEGPPADGTGVEGMYNRAQGISWLESRLEKAGALFAVGGKAYLREMYEEGVEAERGYLARRLGIVFAKEAAPALSAERRICLTCAQIGGLAGWKWKCKLTGKETDVEGDCEYWEPKTKGKRESGKRNRGGSKNLRR